MRTCVHLCVCVCVCVCGACVYVRATDEILRFINTLNTALKVELS